METRSEGLPRVRRLRRRAEFQRAFASELRYHNRLLALHALPVSGGTKFGFAVGKRCGHAVQRNRLRRRLREIVRRRQGEVPAGWHFVVVARLAAGQAPYAELEEAWIDLLRKFREDPRCARRGEV